MDVVLLVDEAGAARETGEAGETGETGEADEPFEAGAQAHTQTDQRARPEKGRAFTAFGRERASRPEAVAVEIPADAELEAADLLDLLTCAKRVDVVLPAQAGALDALVTYAADVAAMCGRPGAIGVVAADEAEHLPRLHSENMPVGRRALIGVPDRPLPEPAATPQRRLVDSVRALLAATGRSIRDIEDAAPDPPTGSARLRAQGCCGDGLCVRVCPRDALRLDVVELGTAEAAGPPGVGAPPKAQSQFRLVQVTADCDGCHACIEMCPNDALVRAGEHSWPALLGSAQEVTLRTGWVRECTRCAAAHRQMGDLCALCKAQQQNPFAVRLPPGFRGTL